MGLGTCKTEFRCSWRNRCKSIRSLKQTAFPWKLDFPKWTESLNNHFSGAILISGCFREGLNWNALLRVAFFFTSCHISQRQNRCSPFRSLSKRACAIFAERLCIWINSAKPISMLFFLHSQDLTLMDRVHPSGDTVLTTAVSPFDEFSPRIWSLKRCQRCIYRCCQWAVLGGLNPPFDSQKKTETHFSQWKLKRLGRAEVQWFDCWSLVF